MTLSDWIKALWNDATAQTPVEIVSRLPRDEVMRRLGQIVETDWTLFASKPLRGRIERGSLRLRRRISYRNSFQTHLFATVHDDGRGTRLVGRTGMHPAVAVFMTLWFALVGLGLAIALVALSHDQSPSWQTLAPMLMIVFGIGLLAGGRWAARNERAEMIAELEQAIDGKAREPMASG